VYSPRFPDFSDPGTSIVRSFVQSGWIASLLYVDSPCPEVILDTLGLAAFSFPTALLQEAIANLGAGSMCPGRLLPSLGPFALVLSNDV
jgi:hypothetical protein